jgi:hypothetical protein
MFLLDYIDDELSNVMVVVVEIVDEYDNHY